VKIKKLYFSVGYNNSGVTKKSIDVLICISVRGSYSSTIFIGISKKSNVTLVANKGVLSPYD